MDTEARVIVSIPQILIHHSKEFSKVEGKHKFSNGRYMLFSRGKRDENLFPGWGRSSKCYHFKYKIIIKAIKNKDCL